LAGREPACLIVPEESDSVVSSDLHRIQNNQIVEAVTIEVCGFNASRGT
jgi:hypothetical protein